MATNVTNLVFPFSYLEEPCKETLMKIKLYRLVYVHLFLNGYVHRDIIFKLQVCLTEEMIAGQPSQSQNFLASHARRMAELFHFEIQAV